MDQSFIKDAELLKKCTNICIIVSNSIKEELENQNKILK